MNFMFSVAMLLGAVEAGVLDGGGNSTEVTFVDSHSKNLVENDPCVRESIRLWKKFWAGGYVAYRERVQDLFCGKFMSEEERNAQLDVAYDCMNRDEWTAHCDIFQHVVFFKSQTSQCLLSELCEPERKFAVGFCKIVKLLSAVNVRTDLITTSQNGVGYLPLRIVDKTSIDEVIDVSRTSVQNRLHQQKRNTIVLNMHKLHQLNDATFKLVVFLWWRVGLWRYPRKNIALISDNLTHGSGLVWLNTLATFMFFLVLPSSKIEFVAWIAIAFYVILRINM